MFPALKFWILKGVLVVKFAFTTAILKIQILPMRRRFARVFSVPRVPLQPQIPGEIHVSFLKYHRHIETASLP